MEVRFHQHLATKGDKGKQSINLFFFYQRDIILLKKSQILFSLSSFIHKIDKTDNHISIINTLSCPNCHLVKQPV